GVIGLGVEIQHILHVPDERRTDTGNAPFFALPRLEVVFFSTRRTVSSETCSTTWNSTKRSGNNWIVQGSRPGGGVLQASATKNASCFPSSLRPHPQRARSVRAAGRPSSTKRWRVRWAVETPTRKASAISSSVASSAAWGKMCARVSLRTEVLPFLIRSNRYFFLALLKSTRYLSPMFSSRLGHYLPWSRVYLSKFLWSSTRAFPSCLHYT